MAKESVEQKAPEAVISLAAFLGTKSLTRAEKTYYIRHYGKEYKELTISQWSKITGLA